MTGSSTLAARAPAPGVLFRAFSGLVGLAQVEEDWAAVLRQVEHPRFPHFFAWYSAWAHHFAEDPGAVRVFVAYSNGAPVAIFPLVSCAARIGGIPVTVLTLPANPHLLICDVLLGAVPARSRLLAEFVEHLRCQVEERWDVLVLPNLLEDSAAWSALRAAPPSRVVSEDADPCEVLPIIPFEQRLARLSAGFRYDLRTGKKKLLQEPALEFVRARRPAEVSAALAEFLAVEGSGWKGVKGSAIRCDERRVGFYRSVALAFAELGCAEINLLRTAGKTIAAQYCLAVGRTLYVLKLGYDEAYSKLAPGHVLLLHVLERSDAEHDFDTVNMLSNAEWFGRFRSESRPRFTAYVFNDSARGLASYGVMRTKERLRPAVRRLRKALERSRRSRAPAPAP